MRDGRVEEITPKVDTPFGFPGPRTYRVQSLDLPPGARLVMLTDGMLERDAHSVDLSELMVRTHDRCRMNGRSTGTVVRRTGQNLGGPKQPWQSRQARVRPDSRGQQSHAQTSASLVGHGAAYGSTWVREL